MNRKKQLSTPVEIDLMRACARTNLSDEEANRIRELVSGELDWSMLQDLANHHRVLPLVYRSLYSTCPDQLPAEAMAELRHDYQINVLRSLYLTHELLKVLDLFESQAIPAIPIKGPVLAKTTYGDVTLRQFDDLDLLVREGDVAFVASLLMSYGYSPLVAPVMAEAKTFLRNEGECGFTSPCGHYHLDIHWQAVPRSFLEIEHEGFWERCVFVSFDGQQVRTLSPSDLVLLLSVHGMRHLWARHAWINDIAQVLQGNPDLDWEGVFDSVEGFGGERFLSVGILLAKEWYELVLPDWVLERVEADRGAYSLAERLKSLPNFSLPLEISLVELYLMHTFARPRLKEKATYLLRQVLTPTLEDWSVIAIPRSLSFFYALLRPLRLLGEYGIKPLLRKVYALKIPSRLS